MIFNHTCATSGTSPLEGTAMLHVTLDVPDAFLVAVPELRAWAENAWYWCSVLVPELRLYPTDSSAESADGQGVRAVLIAFTRLKTQEGKELRTSHVYEKESVLVPKATQAIAGGIAEFMVLVQHDD